MLIRFSPGAILVLIAGVILGIAFNTPYILLLPENTFGSENAAVLLSLFGFGFLLADRLLYLKWKTNSWFVIMKVWLWGVALMIYGLVEWIKAWDSQYLLLTIVHWVVLIGLTILILSKIQTDPEPEDEELEEE